jgi:allantoicase
VDFLDLVDLASERLGGAALAANDEFFAGKENLVKASKPIFDPDAYTDRGKLMDGWETRRRRTPGHDWCLIRLGTPGMISGAIVDTAFFRGNYPESCSIEGCAVEGHPSPEDLLAPETEWTEILPRMSLEGDSPNPFAIDNPYCVTHLRLNIFPDGGVARLRIHGEPLPPASQLRGEIDLAAIENGAQALHSSDMFFGHRHNLIMPGRTPRHSANISDGWQTRRRRGPGHDWLVIRMAAAGELHRVEIDTTHFKGNCPDGCTLEISRGDGAWTEILPRTPLQPNTQNFFDIEGSGTHLRFNIFPDGGVSRLRVYGILSEGGRRDAGLRRLNALLPAAAQARFLECCGATEWAARMAGRRPFPGVEELQEDATHQFAQLTASDWKQAFAAHPRIGAPSGVTSTSQWASEEQSSAGDSRAELAAWNEKYFAKFGYIYIVCATGKTGAEMLELLKQRMSNDPATELRIAAAEQAKITRLRLEKLIAL